LGGSLENLGGQAQKVRTRERRKKKVASIKLKVKLGHALVRNEENA